MSTRYGVGPNIALMKTERVYYYNSYLKEFKAQVLKTVIREKGLAVYLDRTAFYPESGGQPSDRGWIGESPLIDVLDEGERIAHCMGGAPPEGEVQCRVDWGRRFDHMQQHTGQHILSAAFLRHAGYATVSFHLGPESCTIDLESDRVGESQLEAAENLANQIIFENRTVRVDFRSPQDAQQLGLRKSVEREGDLRILEIEEFDLAACGGTHVSHTGAVGALLIRKAEKRKGMTRVEFLCGGRATQAARRDYSILGEVARKFSAGFPEIPPLIDKHFEQLRAAERREERLSERLAHYEAGELLAAANKKASKKKTRRVVKKIFEAEAAARAKSVVRALMENPKVIALIGIRTDPAGLILAQSQGGPENLGQLLHKVTEQCGGKGGGSRDFAQAGRLPAASLEKALRLAEKLLCPSRTR